MNGKKKTETPRKRGRGPFLWVLPLMVAVFGVILAVMLFGRENDWIQPEGSMSPESSTPARQEQTVPGNASDDLPRQEPSMPISLGKGLQITSVGDYSGIFMEDGSDEAVTRILMVILENTSEEALQYAQITLDYGNAQAHFDVTNLPAGKSVVLLEKNRMDYTDEVPLSAEIENVVFMDSFPMHEDLFQITDNEGVINVKNISDQDISGDIYVYYKNVGGGVYYGGITYRIKVEGGLRSGEIRQIMASHYYPDSSEILMVSYGT